MFLLIAFAVLSIGASFLCSVLEAAILSLTPSYIAQVQETNEPLHKKLNALKRDIDRPLAAILTLNTIAHTVGATGVGAQVAVVFGEAWLGVASAVMTLAILILSEIIPKTIGATFWRQLSPWLPPILNTLILLLKPFIWMSEQITQRIGGNAADTDMRGEIKALARIGLDEKALDQDEARTITNILNLHEIKISKVMTPRTVCVTVRPSMTVAQFEQELVRSPFTRFPVMDGGEQAIGYVHKADAYQADESGDMKEIMQDAPSVQADDSVEHVFTMMLRDRQHLAVVYDDHGTWVGLITMEDVIETVLGQDIVDETDNVTNMRKYAKQRWTQRRQGRSAKTDSGDPASQGS
ncbi:CNNM domain-containing protein [Halomonas litopenaei]|uniref:CNNM domain-containing protein n=1 Tax=Halomonas litopenaei TaxID=2109328 RepID=UPI003FA0EA26